VKSMLVASTVGDGDVVYSKGASEVVYPTVEKDATEAMTPLYKTLKSYLASMKRDSKRFAFGMSGLLSTTVNAFCPFTLA